MARSTINYTVTDEGRDKGKIFVITELAADQGERWAMRALLALINEGVEIPEGIERMGMAGLVEIGIKALTKLRFEVISPLLDEMFDCVQFMPDAAKPHIVRKLFSGDIEEIKTRVKLRWEVLQLHADFLKAVAPLYSENQAGTMATPKHKRNA